MNFVIGTTVTRSHLPWVRALHETARAHHADTPLYALVVDDVDDVVQEEFVVLRPRDVGIDDDELRIRGAIYGPQELQGSMRAALLAELLRRTSGDPVVFLDADIIVLGSLLPLVEQAQRAGIVLSPHLPSAPDHRIPLETAMLRAGVFNGGYVAVAGDAGAAFATWWARQLERDCLADWELALGLSQRWLDLAPGFFDVAMLRDPGSNVTVWSLGDREVRRAGDGWTIDGAPLRFLHVSGRFDPRADTWPELSLQDSVTEICREHAARLIASGHETPPAPVYAYATAADGLVLETWIRRLVRREVLDGNAFPDPFREPVAFRAWLAEPVAGAVTRWALALRDWRADLRATFQELPGAHEADYLAWLRTQTDHDVQPEFLGTPT